MNSEANVRDLPPGDPKLTARILSHLKSRGLFDQLRRDCLGDVDTKPAYLNLKQRVDGYITKFLSAQTWTPDMNKNHVRDVMRREINESGMLSAGMDHLVDQIITPKIYHTFTPEVENGVRQFFGLDRPEIAPPQQVSAAQPSETRLSEAQTASGDVSNMAVSAAAPVPDPSIDENAQDGAGVPSPKEHPRPPSPADVVSDASSEPQLMIVTESNDRPDQEDENPIPAPSPESEVATAPVTKEDASEKNTEPNKEAALPTAVAEAEVQEKPQKNADDKPQKPAEEREKEKTARRHDDHKADKAKRDKKTEKDKKTDRDKHGSESKSDSKSKAHSLSRKNSDSSSKSSKTHKSRSDTDASKDRRDGTESSSGKADASKEKETKSRGESSKDEATSSRERGESSKTESSRDKGRHGASSSTKSSRGKDADTKSGSRKSDDRHRSHGGQHHHDRKQHSSRHSGEDEKGKDHHKSRSSESRHGSEKAKSSTKDSSKPHKSSSKSSERPSESSKSSRKEKGHDRKSTEQRNEAVETESKAANEQDSPGLTFWDGREATIEGEEILRFSYVRDKSSGSCEVDMKLVSATCPVVPSSSDEGLNCGSPVRAEPEQKEAPKSRTKPEKPAQPKDEVETLASGEPHKEKERKSHKRRKANASPRASKRSPEKKRQRRGENDGNESDGAWSDVTVSSVHTSDLSSYDDRISLSSTEEVHEDEDSGIKGKLKIPLKEIKKIASISSSNEDDDRLSKSEPEPEGKQTQRSDQNSAAKPQPPAEEKAPLLFSSPGTSGSQDNADAMPEGKRGLRRQRKINPKYVSEEFSSIFTEGKKPAAGTIDFSELANYGKERHHDERARRVHSEPKAGHEGRRQQTPRDEQQQQQQPLPFPPSDLSDHGEPEILPLEEGGLEPRKPSRRLSGSAKSTSPDVSEGRHRSDSTSSKRYKSSDLYKPRPVISSGTRRRSGIQAPTSPTTEEEPEEEQTVRRKKHRPLKICIGHKRAGRLPTGAAPGKRKRV